MTLRINEEIYQSIKKRALREHRSVHAEILAALDGNFREADGSFFGRGEPVGQRSFRTGAPHFPRRIP
jgi:hypothetical protein